MMLGSVGVGDCVLLVRDMVVVCSGDNDVWKVVWKLWGEMMDERLKIKLFWEREREREKVYKLFGFLVYF